MAADEPLAYPVSFQGLPPGFSGASTPTLAVNLFRAADARSHAHALPWQNFMGSTVVGEDEPPDEVIRWPRLPGGSKRASGRIARTFISVSATLRLPPFIQSGE